VVSVHHQRKISRSIPTEVSLEFLPLSRPLPFSVYGGCHHKRFQGQTHAETKEESAASFDPGRAEKGFVEIKDGAEGENDAGYGKNAGDGNDAGFENSAESYAEPKNDAIAVHAFIR